jgi:hypothetical protein
VWKTEHLPHLLQGYRPRDVSNMNTGYLTTHVYTSKSNMRKERVTMLIVENMDATGSVSLLMINESERSHSFKKVIKGKAVPVLN